jgi:hypothetical protein
MLWQVKVLCDWLRQQPMKNSHGFCIQLCGPQMNKVWQRLLLHSPQVKESQLQFVTV